jgi:hypothetical protein
MRAFLNLILLTFFIPAMGQESLIAWDGAERIYHDILGNVYLLKGPEIRKYSSEGRLMSSYSNPIGNRVEIFDPSISTTVLTYHQSFQELVILDNTLNNLYGPLYLIESGLSDVSLIHSSDEQHVWMYERAANQILRYNVVHQKAIWKGPNLDQVYSAVGTPDLMIHTLSGLFLRYPGEGVAQFDIYGNFLRFIPIISSNKMFVVNGAIIWDHLGSLRTYVLKSMFEGQIGILPEDYDDYSISGRYLYYLNEGDVLRKSL